MKNAMNFLKAKANGKKGFTLVELVIVILIIGILFVVLIPQLSTMVNKAKVAGVESAFREYQIAAETVAYEESGFNLDANDEAKVMGELNANLDAKNQLTGTDAASTAADRLDPWGTAYSCAITEDQVVVTSAGPDCDFDDAADNLSTTIAYADGSVTVTSDTDLTA